MSASYSRSQSAIPQMQPAAPMAKTSKVATFTSATLSKAATLKNRVLAPSANIVAYQPGHESLPVNRGDCTSSTCELRPGFMTIALYIDMCQAATQLLQTPYLLCVARTTPVCSLFLARRQCYPVLCSAHVGSLLKAVLFTYPKNTGVRRHSGTDGLTLNAHCEMRTKGKQTEFACW